MDARAPLDDPVSPHAGADAEWPLRRVGLTITEHASYLSPDAVAGYARFVSLLAEITGAEVVSRHYLEPELDVDAVVLSGSEAPWAAHDPADLDRLGEQILAYRGPVLGVCAGMQLLARFAGGRIDHLPPDRSERGWMPIEILAADGLLAGLGDRAVVRQSHTDEIVELPAEFEVLATSPACRIQAIASRIRPWWGTQFHPELQDAEHPDGARILEAFARSAANARRAAGPAPTAPTART